MFFFYKFQILTKIDLILMESNRKNFLASKSVANNNVRLDDENDEIVIVNVSNNKRKREKESNNCKKKRKRK